VGSAALSVLRLDSSGRPVCRDNRLLYRTITDSGLRADPERFERLVTNGFLRDAAERYATFVEPQLRQLGPTVYRMGSPASERAHFCGETPRHRVRLSAFGMAAVPVTNEMYGCFDERRAGLPTETRRLPAVDVSWFDAAVCALWFGARLPTEAEWEYACGADSPEQWCCDDPAELPRHAWYSENAQDALHPVGTRESNRLGLWDMAGNVWEWCQDDYTPGYRERRPMTGLVNEDSESRCGWQVGGQAHKVSRGGGFLALAEMCRTRYRLHDPPEFWARDLGFRMAVSPKSTEVSSDHTDDRGIAGESGLPTGP